MLSRNQYQQVEKLLAHLRPFAIEATYRLFEESRPPKDEGDIAECAMAGGRLASFGDHTVINELRETITDPQEFNDTMQKFVAIITDAIDNYDVNGKHEDVNSLASFMVAAQDIKCFEEYAPDLLNEVTDFAPLYAKVNGIQLTKELALQLCKFIGLFPIRREDMLEIFIKAFRMITPKEFQQVLGL